MSGISAHVLDTMAGTPATGILLRLHHLAHGQDELCLGEGRTDGDGRVRDLLRGAPLQVGTYRLQFVTGPYFADRGIATFFPQVEVFFHVADGAQHYHIPLLLSPFAYSTYRGS